MAEALRMCRVEQSRAFFFCLVRPHSGKCRVIRQMAPLH